jgi:metal-responsive CopG/Arc/MetJ family transcriptional regulator
VKTTIWIPEDLFRQVEAWSRRRKISHSRFFATAAREYLVRHGASEDATEAWNQVADHLSADDHATAAAFARHSKAVIRATIDGE